MGFLNLKSLKPPGRTPDVVVKQVKALACARLLG